MEGLTDDIKVFQDASYYITDHHCLYQRMMHSEVEHSTNDTQKLPETAYPNTNDKNYALADIEELNDQNEISAGGDEQTDFEKELIASIAKLKLAEQGSDEATEVIDYKSNEAKDPDIPKQIDIKNKVVDIPEPNDATDLKKDNPPEPIQSKENTDEVLSPFSMWLLSLETPVITHENSSKTVQSEESSDTPTDITKISKKKKKGKKKKKKKRKQIELEARARRSVELSEELATEALAELLASQGHFKEAKKMFKKLSLIFPEKSSYFAVRIQSIKKKKNDH